MSYGPPPTKSGYGDTDFTTDDSWSNQGAVAQNFDTPIPIDQTWSTDANNLQSTNVQPTISQPFDPQRPQNLSTLTSSISQEDINFMRNWQRDSFLKRVLPLTAVSWGFLFLYNKKNNLPQKYSRYFAAGSLAFVIGKWSYASELKRRLVENPSNSPYMQALRRTLLKQSSSSSDEMYGSNNQYGGAYPPPAHVNGRNSELSNQNLDLNYQPVFETENPIIDSPKQTVSYDELRAKNRGYIR